MVIHVGFNYPDVVIYNDKSKKISPEFVPSEINIYDTYDKMFKEIQKKAKGNLGCICFVSGGNDKEDTRRVEIALSYGFKSVHLINISAAFVLGGIYHSKYNPKNDDIIWLVSQTTISLWQVKNGKIRIFKNYNTVIDQTYIDMIRKESKPTAIFYNDRQNQVEEFIKQFDSNVLFYKIEMFTAVNGALRKARIIANDALRNNIDVEDQLLYTYDVIYEQQIIITAEQYETLPLKKQEIIETYSSDPALGGRDFDNLLTKYFTKKMANDYDITVPDNKKYKLMLKCQHIKENLSLSEDDHFDVEEIDPMHDVWIPISRKEFESMATMLLLKIQCNILFALIKSNFNLNNIDMVLQVGGGSRMPMIKKLLKETFPLAEHICEEHPEEVVAIGAAYYAYYLSEQKRKGQCVIT